MARNLDMTALRAFVAVAECGGVTKAAGVLNLTQSAVSMQVKRLEEAMGRALFHRGGRKLTMSGEGEQVLSYARRMLALNDELLARLSDEACCGELRLGVPDDIVYPHIPGVLKRLAREFPRTRITLISNYTNGLREGFAKGEYDVILTTEDRPDPAAEVLTECDLVWVGAEGGCAWQQRPLRLALEEQCIFRPLALAALEQAGIAWEMGSSGRNCEVMGATAAADLAVTARLRWAVPQGCAVIEGGNALPDLGRIRIAMYTRGAGAGRVAEALAAQLRCAYSDGPAQVLAAE
ncbi:LysR family transcriptional regulator [Solirhodobacter olei]|uniref:LysR family transcriptional regulator n=1 Tax=Solirhodobacter olei TaxID=2493082 RepID=UPI000FDC11E0|nr:LysR family transcriptional regulator [Solirhodobacter olei]